MSEASSVVVAVAFYQDCVVAFDFSIVEDSLEEALGVEVDLSWSVGFPLFLVTNVHALVAVDVHAERLVLGLGGLEGIGE